MRHWLTRTLTARAAAAGVVAMTALALGPNRAITPVRADVWSVSLSASSTTPVNGTTVTLTATASATVTGSLSTIMIFDHTTRALVATCSSGATCSGTAGGYTDAAHAYIAYVAFGTVPLDPPLDNQATSNVVTVTWGAPPTPLPSDSCSAPTITVVDGYVGSTYARLIVEQNGIQTMVCYRLDAGSVLQGGLVTVTTTVPPTPSFDTNIAGCEPGGNLVPGPHPEWDEPLVVPSVGSIPLFLDTYAGPAGAMVCLQVNTVQARVVIPSPTSGPPVVTLTPDPTPAPPPPPVAGPAGDPSSGCLASGGASATSILDVNIDGQQNWLSVWPDGNRAHVCIRTAGPLGIFGGMLTVTDPSTDIGATPVLSVVPGGANTTVCPSASLGPGNDPVPNFVATSNLLGGGTTVSACLIAGPVNVAVTVGFTGTPQVPFPTFPMFSVDPDAI